MATHDYGRVTSLFAGEDLSDKQNYFVVMDSTANTVVLAGAGENAVGVNTENAASGEVTGVMMESGSLIEVVSGAAVAVGAKVASDANGRAITATAGAEVLGEVLEAATAADELITMIWRPNGILA